MPRLAILVSLFIFLFVKQSFGTLQCSRQNEIQKCVSACPPEKSCLNKDLRFNCLQTNKRCQIKCICEEGFYRNYDDDCVPEEYCDRCPAVNEVFKCGSACDTTCATLNKTCPIINIKCNDKCYCRSGYARNDNNVCIPISDCKINGTQTSSGQVRLGRSTHEHKDHNNKGIICGPNEEYQQCKKTCPPDECISLVARFKCVSDPPCKPGCVCKSGFLRDKDNTPCMPIKHCPQLVNSPDFN